MEDDRLMTIDEVAEYLRVSKATVYRLMRDGELPSIKFSARKFTRIRRSDLQAYIDKYAVWRDEK